MNKKTKLNKAFFKKHEACIDGYEWTLSRPDNTVEGTIKELIDIERIDWANWTIARCLNKKQKIQYAVFAARQVLDIFEKEYPDNKSPRKAIEAAEKCIEHNTKKNRAAAYAAAASYAASSAASSAASYAASSASDASYAASYAASAASYASSAASYASYASYASDAAAYAAYASYAASASSAKKKMQLKILDYGLELLK